MLTNIYKYISRTSYLFLKSLKPVKNRIQRESSSIISEIKGELQKEVEDLHPYSRLPRNGFSQEDIKKLFQKMGSSNII